MTLSAWLEDRGINRSDLLASSSAQTRERFEALGRAFFEGNVRPDPWTEPCAGCGAKIVLGAVPNGYVKNPDGTSSILCGACSDQKAALAQAQDVALTPKTRRSDPGVLMVTRLTGGRGALNDYWFPTLVLEDVERARQIITTEHDKLGHAGPGEWFKSCVPQTEGAELLERSVETPAAIRQMIEKGGMDRIYLLYALTLKRTRAKKNPGKGVWIGASAKGA